VVVLLAGAGVVAYLTSVHPASARTTPPLPAKPESHQAVGLVAQDSAPGAASGELLQLLGHRGTAVFSPLSPVQESQGVPQWTADLMAGGSYIFIYLPTGDCLSAIGAATRPSLALSHCDLAATQRWRRTAAAVTIQGHDFYQYANLADSACVTQPSAAPGAGQAAGATLAACSAAQPASQLIAFWWSSV